MPEQLGADGVNLLNCVGSVAWQTVFHFHLHVIPRYENDPLRLPWHPTPGDRDEIAAAAKDLGAYVIRRAVVVLAVLGVLAPIASAQIIPTFRKDSATDGRGALDIVRVAMSRGVDGPPARRGHDGEGAGPRPTCAPPRARRGRSASRSTRRASRAPIPPTGSSARRRRREGEELRGRVLRDRANGLPRQVAARDGDAPDRPHRLPPLRPVGDRPARERALRRRGGHARPPAARSRSAAATPPPTLRRQEN